jgi:hypothetical protein
MKKTIFFTLFLSFAFFCNAQFTFNAETKTISGYTGNPPATLVIPSQIDGVVVQAIGANAFANQTVITTVVIPNSVISIGASAFQDIATLTNLTLGSGLTIIGDNAFKGCTSLSKIFAYPSTPVDLSSSMSAFSGVVLSNCSLFVTKETEAAYESAIVWRDFATNTTTQFVFNASTKTITGFRGLPPVSLVIPSQIDGVAVEVIGTNAFGNKIGIKSVTLPNSLLSIGDYAFQNTSLSSVILPNSVTSIGSSAFMGCSFLTNINLGNSLTSIGTKAFWGTALVNLIIPNSVTTLGKSLCFGVTTLTNLTLGSGLTTIGTSPFANCKGLTSIYALPLVPVDLTGNNYMFQNVNKTNCILYVPSGSLDAYKAAAYWGDFKNIKEISSSNKTK